MRTGLRWPVSTGLVAMAALCVFNFVMTPYFECLTEGDCDDVDPSLLPSIYARSVSVTCLVMVAVSLFRYRDAAAAYRGITELCDAYAPATTGHAMFRSVVTGMYVALVVPVNGYRLYRFVSDGREFAVIVYFILMYSQNVAMCLFETHFVAMFYALYTRFADVNREMEAVGQRIAVDGRSPRQHCSAAMEWSLADAIERLRIRHRLAREAVDALRPAFALPVGLSLCNLCVMALFDVYYHLKNTFGQQTGVRNHMYIYLYLWLTQYTFRFFVITMMVDATTKEASYVFGYTNLEDVPGRQFVISRVLAE